MSDPAAASPLWRKLFKTPSQMTELELPMLIERFMPPGITFLGGPAGHGKSWLALSMAKALFRGEPFLEYFRVSNAIPVVYLVPEVGETAMKQRLRLLGIGAVEDGFFMQTMSDGTPVELGNYHLLQAMRDLKPVVFLDTAARFHKGEDENAASDNRLFVNNIFTLLQHGAQAIVPLHHSIKSLAGGMDPTLENVLRGSGDLGAMADAVYSVVCSDKTNFISEIANVKARDFNPCESFEIQGRPYINESQDLRMIRPPDLEKEEHTNRQAILAGEIIKESSYDISLNDLAKKLNVRKSRAKSLASIEGYRQRGRKWYRS